MRYKPVDIYVVVAVTLIAVVLAFLAPSDNVAGRIWTLPLVLLLPGYALTSALFPRRALGVPERVVFSLALSVAIVVLGGLVLNLTLFGLRADSWAVLLGSITLAASAVALVRQRGRGTPALARSRVARGVGLTFRQGVLLSMAVVVLSGAVAVSIIGAAQQPRPGFTQLWILPTGGADSKNTVRLGVNNMESTPMEYNLDLYVDGKIVKVWNSIDIGSDQKWVATLVLPQTRQTATSRVEAVLYRWNTPTTVYRDVVLWLAR